jgi:serine/threonine protein kinase
MNRREFSHALGRGKIVQHVMPLSIGTRLGPYEILAPIGKGGMGEVYEARDTRLGHYVGGQGLSRAISRV